MDTLTKTLTETSQQLAEKDMENKSLREELHSVQESFEKEREQNIKPLKDRLDQLRENAQKKLPQYKRKE